MNKKLIAAAVSAAVVAPVAAYGEATVYGRIDNAIELKDISNAPGADGTTDLSTISSRFGIKYSQEMGNGLTAHGQYEFATTTDKEKASANDPGFDSDGDGKIDKVNSKGKIDKVDGNSTKHGTSGGIEDVRVASVGLSGAFGRIDAGNLWSSYFNTFGSLISPTYSLGYYIYSNVGSGPTRSSNTIKYSNSFGPLYLELDVRLNESKESSDVAEKISGDGVGLGLSWAVTDGLTIAVATDSEDGAEGDAGAADAPDTDRLGIAAKYSVGGYWISVGTQSHEVDDTAGTSDGTEVDSTFLYFGGNFSESTNWLIGLSSADDGNDAATPKTDDSSQTTWGVYHNLGGGLKLYYEATSLDSENKGWDGSRHLLGMRVDF